MIYPAQNLPEKSPRPVPSLRSSLARLVGDLKGHSVIWIAGFRALACKKGFLDPLNEVLSICPDFFLGVI